MDALRINSRISIPLREIEVRFARSGGPGGQNVNKVESKAVVRFNLRDSPSIPEPARQRALQRLRSRLTIDGDLVIASDVHRAQARNREDALRRLAALLAGAVRPEKKRVSTKPSKAAKRRRLEEKRQRGERKRQRRTVTEAE